MAVMKFYFSGISDPTTFAWLEQAKVKNILVDHRDSVNIPQHRRIEMLDSGAFRAYKAGTQINLRAYIAGVEKLHERCDYIVAPDVVGDSFQTLENWRAVNRELPGLQEKFIPVWQFGTPQDHLKFYLDNAAVVGIGSLAGIFHNDKTEAEKSLREETLALLLRLCQKLPNRFHIFGLNYLKGIEVLAPFAASADSSNFLRGARYSYVIFQNSKTKRLTQAPSRSIPQFNRLDRAGRCITNAANIENFLSTPIFSA
jgi:hypothetical protein